MTIGTDVHAPMRRAEQGQRTPTRARLLALLWLVGSVAVACSGAKPVPAPAALEGQEVLAFENVRLFDGEQVHPSTKVLVVDGVIHSVGKDLSIPDGAAIIDGAGKTLLPGLIDAHAHVFQPQALAQSAVYGVTTVLDMGCVNPQVGRQLKETAQAAGSQMAQLRFAGFGVTVPGGHCTHFGFPVPTVTQASEVPAFVDARVEEGSDYIKIIYDDVTTIGLSMPTLDSGMLEAAIRAAHARDRLAVVHVSSLRAAAEAIALKADGLAHVPLDGIAEGTLAAQAASQKTFLVPTLSVTRSMLGLRNAELLDDQALTAFLPAAARPGLIGTFPQQEEGVSARYPFAERTTKAFADAGARVLVGSDAPNPGTTYGLTMHGELALLVEVGLTPIDALRGATSSAADAFRMDDRGRVKAGLRADLLLVEGDPTSDIRATRQIAGVWIGGTAIDREAFVAASRPKPATKVEVAPGFVVSDFETEVAAAFGSWVETTDSIQGGSSTSSIERVEGGAEGSSGALKVSGEIKAGAAYPWAGVMLTPGAQPFSPVDLSSVEGFSFQTRGDGKTYGVMLFTASRGGAPIVRTFVSSGEWTEHTLSWSDFEGSRGEDVTAIAFVGGPVPGTFVFELDTLTLR